MELHIPSNFKGDSFSFKIINNEIIININDNFIVDIGRLIYGVYPSFIKYMKLSSDNTKENIITIKNDLKNIKFNKYSYGIFDCENEYFKNTYFKNTYFIARRENNNWILIDVYYGDYKENYTPRLDIVKDRLKKSCKVNIKRWLHDYLATPLYEDNDFITVVQKYDKIIKGKNK